MNGGGTPEIAFNDDDGYSFSLVCVGVALVLCFFWSLVLLVISLFCFYGCSFFSGAFLACFVA
jgi:hypothetical protein